MKRGRGHAKGSAFERVIAKMVVKAFRRQGIRQQDCWRSVLSGGHAISAGDLVMSKALEELFLRCVECKFHRKINWWRFLVPEEKRQKSWLEWQWVSQVKEATAKRRVAAAKQGYSFSNIIEPLLVMKENHGPILAYGPYVGHDSEEWGLMPFAAFLTDVVEML